MNETLKKFKKGGYNIYTKQKTNRRNTYKSKRSKSLKTRSRKSIKSTTKKSTSKSFYL